MHDAFRAEGMVPNDLNITNDHDTFILAERPERDPLLVLSNSVTQCPALMPLAYTPQTQPLEIAVFDFRRSATCVMVNGD